jgi:hypothetical protein
MLSEHSIPTDTVDVVGDGVVVAAGTRTGALHRVTHDVVTVATIVTPTVAVDVGTRCMMIVGTTIALDVGTRWMMIVDDSLQQTGKAPTRVQ